MSEKTGIAWCDSTFNPWIGCTKVSPGCDNCYAERDFGHRLGVSQWGAGQPRVRTSPSNWRQPAKWNARPFYECPGCGWRGGGPVAHDAATGDAYCPTLDCTGVLKPARRRVFCASLADVFDNEVPHEWRADLFRVIDATPNIDWLLLTKRIGKVGPMMRDILRPQPTPMPPNVWLGITVVNQAEADRDIPKLLATPAARYWISAEPLIGLVDLSRWLDDGSNEMALAGSLDWIVAGGESGPQARPMHPDWVRSLRDQCAAAGVPFLFKQWGEWTPTGGDDGWYKDHPVSLPLRCWNGSEWSDDPVGHGSRSEWMARIGKKAAGRLLDGVIHDAYPA